MRIFIWGRGGRAPPSHPLFTSVTGTVIGTSHDVICREILASIILCTFNFLIIFVCIIFFTWSHGQLRRLDSRAAVGQLEKNEQLSICCAAPLVLIVLRRRNSHIIILYLKKPQSGGRNAFVGFISWGRVAVSRGAWNADAGDARTRDAQPFPRFITLSHSLSRSQFSAASVNFFSYRQIGAYAVCTNYQKPQLRYTLNYTFVGN